MAVIAIRQIRNVSSGNVRVRNLETPSDTDNGKGDLAPGESRDINIWIPWCADGVSFNTRHIDVTVVGVTRDKKDRTFTIWQATQSDGDRVRVSTDAAWHNPGTEIGGYAAVGIVETNTLGDDRVLVVHDASVWLVPNVVITLAQQMATTVAADGYRLCDEHKHLVPSVPRLRASAFSMAGPPSDAFDLRQPGARFLYRDSGKRYEFTIANGRVSVQPPPAVPVLQEAISFNARRRGEPITPLPVFDLIAANNGRVFAKEANTDRFFVAIIDEMFIQGTPLGEIAAPSSYFKLDPEFNTAGAHMSDVMAHMDGDFAGHPAVERFPLFRFGLSLGIAPTFVVRVRRGVWHLLDARPPVIDLAGAALQTLIGDLAALSGIYASSARLLQLAVSVVQNLTPPPGTPVYDHARYCPNPPLPNVWQQSINLGDRAAGDAFGKVLDIGVGHVHLHDQYEGVTGGEMQMLTANPSSTEIFATHGELYRFMNGPIDDLDGFNDGTCNYYVLAQLSSGAYALLYIDEQTFFSQRWRLVGPDDRNGLMFSLTADLAANPSRYGPPGHPWDPSCYWSPFGSPAGPPSGQIGAKSRLAVSAQVLLVTADLAPGIEPLIYSINFSWGTMDRTWRWRALPAGATPTALPDETIEQIPPSTGTTVFTQTIRLRGDMTLHLMGTRNGVPGRWYQRYLPASNQMAPPLIGLVAGQRPAVGYTHAWKFVTETVFARADQFSHFGVYDQVDSRRKYYPVDVAAADVPTLDAVAARADDWWTDSGLPAPNPRLFINRYTFDLRTMHLPWPPLPPFPQQPMVPASMYNPDTMLRIVRRGTRWIAIHWDKRDDDMVPLDGLPQTLTLTNRARDKTVRVTLYPGVRVASPPAVATAYFWWEDSANAGIAFVLSTGVAATLVRDSIWRVRMAALDDAGSVVTLQDVTLDSFTYSAAAAAYVYRWTPSATAATALRRYATADAMVGNGTSIWFQDVTGHVAPPDEIRWARPAEMRVTVTPAVIPLDVEVRVTVHAVDANTGALINGMVSVYGETLAHTDEPFTHTFSIATAEDPVDPENPRPGPLPTRDYPTGQVTAPGYPATKIPFTFAPALGASFVSQSVPAALTAGQSAAVSVTMRNTGATTWAAGGANAFRLGSQNPQDNSTWGLGRVGLAADVPFGGTATFNFTIVAPRTAGAYAFSWRMVEEGITWFGAFTPTVTIQVAPKPKDTKETKDVKDKDGDKVKDKDKLALDRAPSGTLLVRGLVPEGLADEQSSDGLRTFIRPDERPLVGPAAAEPPEDLT